MARFVPIWMKIEPSSAATNGPGRKMPRSIATAVPTSTGATAAGSVRMRAAISQMRSPLGGETAVAMADAYGRFGKREKSGRRFSR